MSQCEVFPLSTVHPLDAFSLVTKAEARYDADCLKSFCYLSPTIEPLNSAMSYLDEMQEEREKNARGSVLSNPLISKMK